MYICNAFSLNMFKSEVRLGISKLSITPIEIKDIPLDVISAIGHAETAKILTGLLGFDIPLNRVNVTLGNGDSLIVAQYYGPRLPEGATTLPEGARIEFSLLKIEI